MLEIDNKIVSLDLLKQHFSCDLAACRGMCCVEGNAGAPLEPDEVDALEAEYGNYKPFLKPEGVKAIDSQGFMVVDGDGDHTTPLIDGLECAYSFDEGGVTLCAVERAFREGRTTFRKPISCHLYPIRVTRFRSGSLGLNYHRWDICAPAVACGKREGVPVYKALREPIVRAFGEEFFEALEEAAEFINKGEL